MAASSGITEPRIRGSAGRSKRFTPEKCISVSEGPYDPDDPVEPIQLALASGCNMLIACTEPCKYLQQHGAGERLPNSSSIRFLLVEKPGKRELTQEVRQLLGCF